MRIVLIDGENFLYGLRSLVGSKNNHAPRDRFISFPFRALIEEVSDATQVDPIYYYGARLKQYTQSETLLEKTKHAIKFQLKLANTLKKNDIELVKAGYLRARETEPCPDCGRTEWKLLEKGVDVGLAVRMIKEARPGLEIVLISSDTDLLPAVQAARTKGAEVVFVGYEVQPVLALVKAADRTRTITAHAVKKYMTKDPKNG